MFEIVVKMGRNATANNANVRGLQGTGSKSITNFTGLDAYKNKPWGHLWLLLYPFYIKILTSRVLKR